MLKLLKEMDKKRMVIGVNFLVFTFFITVLSFKKGYSYVPMLFAVIGVIYIFFYYFFFRKRFVFTQDDKILSFSFFVYFTSFLISVLFHSDSFREIDNPSRVLLFLPLILFFANFPISFKTLLYAIPIGAAVVGVLAIYHKFIMGMEHAFPEIMRIQAGDISISLAIMSLLIAIYWAIKKQYGLMILSICCFCLGALASALSGARGGWVGLPIIIAIILYFAYQFLNKKMILGILTTFVLSITAVIILPQTNVANRMNIAYDEIVNYIEKDERHTSLGARFDMWNSALLGIKEKPMLGWGSKGYRELKQEQLAQNIIIHSTLDYNDSHNQYLDSLVKRGVIGFIGILLIFLTPLFLFYKNLRKSALEIKLLSMLGITFIISTMFYSLSQTFLAHNSGSIFYFFVLIIFYSAQRHLINLENLEKYSS